MIAYALSMTLFLFWLVVGLAVLRLLYTGRNLLCNVLLAPTLGMATTTLPIVWLNRAGLPIASFSLPLTIGLLLAGLAGCWWKRPFGSTRAYVPVLRAYLPFFGVLLVALEVRPRSGCFEGAEGC